ncbi:DUF2487 family protein [Paenibacillus barcinonensis]|uniref:DUF2487 family protein n=1 Tax=Paenibacillus barcinonensis TaxID=198119 RepID=A0A2V4WSI2_PAEBA|nr:DUF2487 family protein [Paenibacillus barcinonensis]PYE51319.1 uncharacterized protein DUF2487 [Paenibacillus barcinonensis]QKS55720.1 DUF2487 family protein [Paenibacillus barcinonensis]
MKFSEMNHNSWAELQLYLDTCLVPFTAMSGQQSPVEATEALERLRDFLDTVEIPFKGRIMTYPAYHYISTEMSMTLNTLSSELKASGFKYVVIMSADGSFSGVEIPNADLLLSQQDLLQQMERESIPRHVGECIRDLWKK